MAFPVIVLDGPDAVGKSTLAAAFKARHGARVIHLTYRFKDRMHQYQTAALNLALSLAEQGPVIIDRWWASEVTYANAYRGGSPWPLMPRFLHREAMAHGFQYIWCLPRNKTKYLENYEENKAKRGKDYTPGGRKADYASGMARVYDEYHRILYTDDAWRINSADLTYVGHEIYDFMDWPDEVLWHAWIDKMFVDASNIRNACEEYLLRVTGNTRNPELIFIGEKSNFKGRREVPPFFEYANSSLWLTGIFETYGAREDRMALVNPNKTDDALDYDVMAWVRRRQSAGSHVVAMGRVAELALQIAGLKWDSFTHHPQYYRRFRPDEGKAVLASILMQTGVM